MALPPQPGPTGMTYTSLLKDARAYLERGSADDVTVIEQLPRVINRVERSAANRMKILGYLEPYTSKMKAGNPVISKPENWQSTVSINYGSGITQSRRKSMRPRSLEYIRAVYPNQLSMNAPEYYADYNLGNWFVGPTPSYDFPFEAIIWRLPPLLSDSNEVNYLTRFAPNYLLYSVLAAMEGFLRDDSRIGVWKSQAEEEFKALNVEDIKRMVDRGTERTTA